MEHPPGHQLAAIPNGWKTRVSENLVKLPNCLGSDSGVTAAAVLASLKGCLKGAASMQASKFLVIDV